MTRIIRHYKHAVNVHTVERWVSAVVGAALAAEGICRQSRQGVARALAGLELVRRGATGHCLVYEALGVRSAPAGQGASVSVPYELGVRIDRSIVIRRPPEEVYRYWRFLPNLARFMKNIESVEETGGNRSHWKMKMESGPTLEWDAVIHNEEANERIAWRSLPGSDVDHAGTVTFEPTPDGHGTELRFEMQFNPPGGAVGAALAKLFGDDPDRQMGEDLVRLRDQLESRVTHS